MKKKPSSFPRLFLWPALLLALLLLSGCGQRQDVSVPSASPSPSAPAASQAQTPESPTKTPPTTQAAPSPQPSPSPSSVPSPSPVPSSMPSPSTAPSPSPSPSPATEPEDTADPALTQAAQTILEGMTLHEKVCQLFLVKPEQLVGSDATVTAAGELTQSALQTYPVGGLVYFADNLVTREQTAAMIAGAQSFSKLGLFIAVDEEGGAVARLGSNSAMGTTAFPPMGTIGAAGDTDQAYQVGLTIGREIKALGFNLDFAPVADVNSNPDNPVIGTRAFSADATVCAAMVSSCVQGFHAGGMLCTLKHFPGHGDTGTDSHTGYAATSRSLGELVACEFVPFAAGIQAGADLVMVGHIATPAATGNDLPASLSYAVVTGFLRQYLHFSGVVITDAMNMGAITEAYSSSEAAVLAIGAGVDIVLAPADFPAAVQGVEDAVASGTLPEARIDESVLRILQLKLSSGILSASG